jgi:hypothetical protein
MRQSFHYSDLAVDVECRIHATEDNSNHRKDAQLVPRKGLLTVEW